MLQPGGHDVIEMLSELFNVVLIIKTIFRIQKQCSGIALLEGDVTNLNNYRPV